ncbi:MAG: hypothetical protein WC565_00440 [Parcubacteria group bacterium]
MEPMVGQKRGRIISVHVEHELLLKLEKAGLTNNLAQRVIESKNNELATKIVVRLIQNCGFEATTSQRQAREIMGSNMFGIEESIAQFGVRPTKEQLDVLAEVPFTEDTLKECRKTHVLVSVFPLSILDIRGRVEHELFEDHADAWINGQAFANERGDASWCLIRKTPVDGSTYRDWFGQQALLAKNEETPTTRAMTYMIIGHYLTTGERLFEYVRVRCRDVDPGLGGRVSIGYSGEEGISISALWLDKCSDTVGVSTARKFDKVPNP